VSGVYVGAGCMYGVVHGTSGPGQHSGFTCRFCEYRSVFDIKFLKMNLNKIE
jgi:hypothetical protein